MHTEPSDDGMSKPRLIPESSDTPSNVTRRSFLKRTGGATIATMTTWSIMTNTGHGHPPGQSCIQKPIYKKYKVIKSGGVTVSGTGLTEAKAIEAFHKACNSNDLSGPGKSTVTSDQPSGCTLEYPHELDPPEVRNSAGTSLAPTPVENVGNGTFTCTKTFAEDSFFYIVFRTKTAPPPPTP